MTNRKINGAAKKPRLDARTKNGPWNKWAAAQLRRPNPIPAYHMTPLDPGTNYFVLQLERAGAVTTFSCEGHPDGFYVSFEADETLARRIASIGYFSVEIENRINGWSIRTRHAKSEAERIFILSRAAEAWDANFGPIPDGIDEQAA
jgi:hypothetical protein